MAIETVHGCYIRIVDYNAEDPEAAELGVESGHIELWNADDDLVCYLDDYAATVFEQFPEVGEGTVVGLIMFIERDDTGKATKVWFERELKALE